MFACLELVRQLDWGADRARHGLDRLLAELLDPVEVGQDVLPAGSYPRLLQRRNFLLHLPVIQIKFLLHSHIVTKNNFSVLVKAVISVQRRVWVQSRERLWSERRGCESVESEWESKAVRVLPPVDLKPDVSWPGRVSV